MSDSKAIVGAEPKDFYIELDRRDQQQIVMAAMGDVVDELFYTVHGQKALSWEGINTAAYIMGDIEIDPWVEWERIEMFGDRFYWSATVRARNTRFGLSSLGIAETPELMDVYDRDERNNKIPVPDKPGEFKKHLEPDEFCRRKALSKAQRNAKRAVMPTAVLKKWLQYFIELKLFQKGTRTEKPGIPFKPKTVDAEYQVLGDLKPEKENEKKVAKKAEKKKVQLSLGSVNVSVINYNLKPLGVVDDVDVSEEDDGYYIVPSAGLAGDDYDQVNETLVDMGAEWLEDRKLWIIRKEASD
jgi:hypothetical protein